MLFCMGVDLAPVYGLAGDGVRLLPIVAGKPQDPFTSPTGAGSDKALGHEGGEVFEIYPGDIGVTRFE